MILILEVISPQPTKLGGASRQTFNGEGGSIGRTDDNLWVLPHSKVSGHHALISCRNAVYYIEDTSRNGVCLNSSKNRLVRGRPYALKSGDRILIDPYEIRVSVTGDQNDAAGPSNPFDADDPFEPQPILSEGLDAPGELISDKELDPMALLNLGPKDAGRQRQAPSARDLNLDSPLNAHFQPPAVMPAPVAMPPRQDVPVIPPGYDPLAPDDPSSASMRAFPVPATLPDERPVRPIERQPPAPAPPVAVAPPRVPRAPDPEPVRDRAPVVTRPDQPFAADFAAVLAGAGLDPASVTPEIARTFGEILRVVVSGVMDVMRSRQQIKDEFRMRMTRFRAAENNPLKFSANVDDALHNLLVKRNPAFLGPVEAFEDAFADLRNHQIAMLGGMRAAFESMLAEFDPDRLQQEFDRQLNKGLVPAKLRYWDLFRERRRDIVKDPEASFRRLFGEEFARAYEEQLKQLKAMESGGRES